MIGPMIDFLKRLSLLKVERSRLVTFFFPGSKNYSPLLKKIQNAKKIFHCELSLLSLFSNSQKTKQNKTEVQTNEKNE